MQNHMLIFLLFSTLSTSRLTFTMEEQNPVSSNITENNDSIDLENIKQLYLDSSILVQANDIHEAINIITEHISRCHSSASLDCKTFNDLKVLNISSEQWIEFNQTIRELYIPYLTEIFLEKRTEQEWLYPKNAEWFADEELPINDHIAYFIKTRSTADRNFLTFLVHLISARSNIHIPNITATTESIMKLIALLLFYGINPNIVNNPTPTSLNYAVRHHDSADSNSLKLISLLLQYGANPNIMDDDGSYALNMIIMNHHPIHSDNTELISLLLQYGADTNLKDQNGWAPLFILVGRYHPIKSNNIDLINLLLQHGANPDIQDPDKFTGLYVLVKKYNTTNQEHTVNCNNTKLIALLLKYGANPYLESNEGKSAFDIAQEKNFSEVKQLIQIHTKNTLQKICLLAVLNNLTLLEDRLNTLPIELQVKINNLKSN